MVGDSMKKNDDCDIQRRSNSQEVSFVVFPGIISEIATDHQ